MKHRKTKIYLLPCLMLMCLFHLLYLVTKVINSSAKKKKEKKRKKSNGCVVSAPGYRSCVSNNDRFLLCWPRGSMELSILQHSLVKPKTSTEDP